MSLRSLFWGWHHFSFQLMKGFPKRKKKKSLFVQGLIAFLFPAILERGVEAMGDEEWVPQVVCCIVLTLLLFTEPRGCWSCPKCAEWSLFLTFLLPKVCLAFKEYRSKEPSVLLAALGNKRQRPFKGGRRVKSPADVRFQCVSQAPGSCSRLVAEASAQDSFVGSQKEIPGYE